MSRIERLGLALLAGGIGVGLSVGASWVLGRTAFGVRPLVSGGLMVVGLALLAVAVVRGGRGKA